MAIRAMRHAISMFQQNSILNLNETTLEFVEFVPLLAMVKIPVFSYSQPSITGNVYVVAPFALR